MTDNSQRPAPSDVRLFGIVYDGVTVGGSTRALDIRQAEKDPLRADQDSREEGGQQAFKLAQIFSFSCDGRYVPLPSAVLIQVANEGQSVDAITMDLANRIRLLGFAPQDDTLPKGLQMWVGDRSSVTTRYEVATGTLFDLLVGPAFAALGVGPAARRPDIVGQEGNLAARVSASKMWLW